MKSIFIALKETVDDVESGGDREFGGLRCHSLCPNLRRVCHPPQAIGRIPFRGDVLSTLGTERVAKHSRVFRRLSPHKIPHAVCLRPNRGQEEAIGGA